MRRRGHISTLFLLLFPSLVACGPARTPRQPLPPIDDARAAADDLVEAREADVFCPQGFLYDVRYRMCITPRDGEEMALGWFTEEMIATCKADGTLTAAQCEERLWPASLARRLRGEGFCPRGAKFDAARSVCVEGENAFGPFLPDALARCLDNGGGEPCHSMRWHVSFIPPHAEERPAAGGGKLREKLFAWYSQPANYQRVHDEVVSLRGEARYGGVRTTTNGCVAFVTTAMRHVGYDIDRNLMHAGAFVWLYIPSLLWHLEGSRGWHREVAMEELVPGDVFFSKDNGSINHVMMFHSWIDARTANVIDNQGFTHLRDLTGGRKSPYAFTLLMGE